MAGSKRYFLEVELLKWATGQDSIFITPNIPWLALLTEAPTNDTDGVEASGGGYGRLNSFGMYGAPVKVDHKAQIYNNIDIEFLPASGNQGLIVAAGLMNAQEGGNMLYWMILEEAVSVTSGGIFRFKIEKLVLKED